MGTSAPGAAGAVSKRGRSRSSSAWAIACWTTFCSSRRLGSSSESRTLPIAASPMSGWPSPWCDLDRAV